MLFKFGFFIIHKLGREVTDSFFSNSRTIFVEDIRFTETFASGIRHSHHFYQGYGVIVPLQSWHGYFSIFVNKFI